MSDEPQEQPVEQQADLAFAGTVAAGLLTSIQELHAMVSRLEVLAAELHGHYPTATLVRAGQALTMWYVALGPLLEWMAATLPRDESA